MLKNQKKFILFTLAGLFLLNVLAWIAVFDLSKPRFLEVNFFDIGQGDAIFIETPQYHQILIDGGSTSAILEKLGKEMPFWDKSIDLIILTHLERDHMAGLIEVLKEYKVENILWTGIIRDTVEFKEWHDLLEKEKAKIFIAKTGQRITFSRRPGLVDKYIDILHPFENLAGKEFKDSNDNSIVSKLTFGQPPFLFTGDISKSVEKELVIRENSCVNSPAPYRTEGSGTGCELARLKSDVLKVAHHGSKTSSSEEFLKEVLPEIAIIQVGKNSYGHPHSEILERLENFGIRILRTDQIGDIKIISDGKNLKISNLKTILND